MGTGCWWMSGLLQGASFYPLFLGSLSLLSDLARWAGGYRSVGVDWWVSGLLGSSFYHQHPPPTPPTTNISLLSDVRQRTNLAWRANTMVPINAYNTTQHHQLKYGSVLTPENTTLEGFLRREINRTTKDNTHSLHILAGGG